MEDTAIIDLFWDRDEAAIRETDIAYGKKLYVLANRIVQCHEEAQESVNDTYWKAWETIPPHRPSDFFGFLAKQCRRFAMERVDWRSTFKHKTRAGVLSTEMEQCIPVQREGMELEAPELGRLMNRFMENISQENRLIFMRRYWYMDTTAEISQRFGLSERRVSNKLRRTREKLHTFLEREGICL